VRRTLLAIAIVLAPFAPATAQHAIQWTAEEVRQVSTHGPWPPGPVRDPSNRVFGKPEAIVLGHQLFNERRLSAGGGMSCADCHQAGRDWRDGRPLGFGVVELDRRTPSLWNVGFMHWFGWDGAADSLWMQSIRPLLDRREMGNSPRGIARVVRDDKDLSCGYARAFGEPPGADDERIVVDLAKALAAFQATLVTPRTTFDDFRDALLARDAGRMARYPLAAQRGLKIFVGKGGCTNCHLGPLFSNGEFGDVGIPFFVKSGSVDSGRHGGIERLQQSPFNRLGKHSDDASGHSATRTRHVERQHRNFGEFRVPGLRQVGRTGPYMHNGSIDTLEDVVKHYSEVSPDRLHSDGLPLVRPLGLSAGERADLVAFLRTLDAAAPKPSPPSVLCP
jgi:cytochrome c peroxidase